MAEPRHSDPSDANIDAHPVAVAVGVGIGLVALVVGIVLLAQLGINAYSDRSMKDEPAMSEAAVAKRLAPVAKLVVDPNAPPPTPPAQPAVPVAQVAVASAANGADAGKATFDKVCSACHATGVLNAPKLGDKAAWAPRIAQGKDTLYNAALHGLRAMPPKGGQAGLPDSDVKAAVDYMVNAAK
jgi:cytochrome c5